MSRQVGKYEPRNDRHPNQRRQNAKHHRHDTPRREPIRQPIRRLRNARQVEEIFIVARRVADDGDILRLASVEVVWRDGEGVLERGGGFNHRRDQAGRDVPFNVAVEEPDAWREEKS